MGKTKQQKSYIGFFGGGILSGTYNFIFSVKDGDPVEKLEEFKKIYGGIDTTSDEFVLRGRYYESNDPDGDLEKFKKKAKSAKSGYVNGLVAVKSANIKSLDSVMKGITKSKVKTWRCPKKSKGKGKKNDEEEEKPKSKGKKNKKNDDSDDEEEKPKSKGKKNKKIDIEDSDDELNENFDDEE